MHGKWNTGENRCPECKWCVCSSPMTAEPYRSRSMYRCGLHKVQCSDHNADGRCSDFERPRLLSRAWWRRWLFPH